MTIMTMATTGIIIMTMSRAPPSSRPRREPAWRSDPFFAIVHDQPIDPMAINMFIDLLRSTHGEKLLR